MTRHPFIRNAWAARLPTIPSPKTMTHGLSRISARMPLVAATPAIRDAAAISGSMFSGTGMTSREVSYRNAEACLP